MESSVEIVILAGGKSRRMGTDKSKLVLGEKSLLQRVQELAAGAGLPTKMIDRDVVESRGPLGGIITAFRSTNSTGVLFLSVDMPFVPTNYLNDLVGKFDRDSRACFTRLDGFLGFPFVLPSNVLPISERLYLEEEYSLQKLASEIDADSMKVSEAMADDFLNINTPRDWEIAVTRLENANE